jgi:hypothetical protein
MMNKITGVMAHTCNLNYSGGRDWVDCDSGPGKKLAKPHLNQYLNVVGGVCLSSQLRRKHK